VEFVLRRLPMARLERTASDARLVSATDRVALGLAAVAGDVWSDPAPDLLDEPLRSRLLAAIEGAGGNPHRALAAAYPRAPALDGGGTPHPDAWPAYEGLMDDADAAALLEREYADVLTSVLVWLGRRELPAAVGMDVLEPLLVSLEDSPALESMRDWEGFLTWAAGLDDAAFDRRMGPCLAAGNYRLRSR